jgi:hypothetical protein
MILTANSYCSLNTTDRLVFVKEMQCIFHAVGTDFFFYLCDCPDGAINNIGNGRDGEMFL